MINKRAFMIYIIQTSVFATLGILIIFFISSLWLEILSITILLICWIVVLKRYLSKVTLIKKHRRDK